MPGRWSLVVPVKDAALGKTRLSALLDETARAALVRAMALDTVAAAVACPAVGRVLVVTADAVVAREVQGPGVLVVPEPVRRGARSGLDAAAAAGIAAARALDRQTPVGVLLGDLPALRPDDLAAALAAADRHPRAMAADAAGTGTTLLTVGAGVAAGPTRFGAGSAAAHAALGHVPLPLPESSSVRQDVDLPADLAALRASRPGPRTTRLLDELAAPGR